MVERRLASLKRHVGNRKSVMAITACLQGADLASNRDREAPMSKNISLAPLQTQPMKPK
jgi:hypothetical protein